MPSIKILTWNTHGGLTKAQSSFILKQIAQHQFDVVALQELPIKGAGTILKGSSGDYSSIRVQHTLPILPLNSPYESIDYLGVRGTTGTNEDDSYLIMSNVKTIKVVTHFMPKYLTNPLIQQELSPFAATTRTRTTRKRPNPSLMNQLAMRRPYYVKMMKNGRVVHFLCWHAPEGGNKMQALPAIRLLRRTAFKFMPGRKVGQNVIIAGDLNARYQKVITTLAGDRRQWSSWKGVSAQWDHILAYGVKRSTKLDFTEKWKGTDSDHPPVAAEITF